MKSFRAVVSVVCFLIWSFGSIFCAGEIKQKDGIDGNWYEKVTKNIKDSEYEIRWQEKYNEYQSPNRAQNLRFSYYSDGFKVKNRDEEKWSVLFKLTNYGKEDKVKKYNSNAKLEVEKNKGYVRGKEVEIEFENSEKGMRENFVVKEMPKGSGDLVLFFKVKTSKVKMDVEKEKIDFVMDVRGGAKVLRYGDLNVTDNKGKKLNGYFKLIEKNRFAIVVEDRDAEYPITIDPLSSTPNWTGESNQESAFFGWSVSTAGDVNGDGYSDVIVGAYYYDNPETNEGRAYVYYGSSSGLSAEPNWTAESNQANAYFGVSVSSAGDVNGDGYSDVIIGAYYYDNPETNEGRAYVYYGSSSGLSAEPNWTAESNQASAYFGYSVSTAGDVNGDGYSDVIVGAYAFDNGQTNEGRAFLYYGSATGLSSIPDWTGESNQVSARYGISVSTAGDVNGDGYSDIIIGAYLYDNGETNEGRAYVYYGSATGLSSIPDWTGESNQVSAYFGWSVSTAGDVNGDGYSDVIVGAYAFDNGQTNEGRAFLYYGSATGLSSIPDWTGESNQQDAYFGWSVSTAGDVNGDGYSDIIIGAYCYDNGETYEGRAYVYYGSASGLSSTPDWTGESNQGWAYFGISVSTAGDVNGDGYSDVIVGALYYDNGEAEEGMAFVYYGSASGLSLTPNWTGESNQEYSYFGRSVSSAGDVNGDGYSDVIVGADLYDNGETDEGRAFVYYGSASGLSLTPNWTGESNQASAYFGWSVSTAGDVNGDGYSDVIVGAYYYDNGETDEGRAYVYYGSSSGLSSTPDWTGESNQASAYFGNSVSQAGDVNGDGYSDVIVGAYYYDNGQDNEGAAFVYYGNEGRGRDIQLQQLRSDFSSPIVPALFTYSFDSFGIKGNLYSTYGRVLIKAQIEVKQYGTPFDGTGLYQTDWIDMNTQGLPFQEVVSGLDDWKLYKWRFRIKYHPKYGKSDLHSRWYYIQSNALQEADFRTNGLDPMQDADGDGVLNGEDCRPYDGSVWAAPSVNITEFKITREATNNFTWVVPSTSTWGSQSVTLDILRSTSPSNFNSSTCRATDLAGTQTTFTDTEEPTSGTVWYYLLRIENVCGFKMGNDSNGNPRSGRSCP